jgi:Domain of unknown function (DUF6907)
VEEDGQVGEWRQEAPPCPAWCTNGNRHLDFQLNSSGGYWHESAAMRVAQTGGDEVTHPMPCEVRKVQRVQIDDRGYYIHPIEVEVAGMTFTAENARTLADILNTLAVDADTNNPQRH